MATAPDRLPGAAGCTQAILLGMLSTGLGLDLAGSMGRAEG